MTIPAGHQLHVTSWENDGDNYQTKIMSGLSEHEVRFCLDLLSNFGRHGRYGNREVNPEILMDIIDITLDRHKEVSKEFAVKWRNGVITIYDLLGQCSYDEAHFVRFFERYEVYFVPFQVNKVTDFFPVQRPQV